jgi:hypothetical protein
MMRSYTQLTQAERYQIEAVKFVSDLLDTKALQSVSVPENFSSDSNYKVVFALSFFSHVNKHLFGCWLRALLNCVQIGGFLIFTTHGEVSRRMIAHDLHFIDGFIFQEESEQKDLQVHDYGLAYATQAYIEKVCEEFCDHKVFLYREKEWLGRQDMYIVKRQK